MASPITTVMDLRELAKRRVPRAFFEYADRGSYEERTINENTRAFSEIYLRQKVMCDMDHRTHNTTIMEQPVNLPLVLAPTGLTGLQHGSGEILAAKAAANKGIPFCLSTMSICSIEQVQKASPTPFWFQIYVMRDREFTKELIQRAVAANCSALMVTVDLTIQGQRHREIKNGMTVPPKLTLANAFDMLSKPRWLWHILQSPSRSFGNLEGRIQGSDNLTTLAQWIGKQFDPTLQWKDLEWIRQLWPGKLIIKGIMDADDAKIACQEGVDALVVSNHGGRQLDGAPASISVLPNILENISGKTEVLIDSGITTGQSLLKSLALGARAGLIGKAFLYGLGAQGQAGVEKVIDIITKELDVSMALTGQKHASEINRSILVNQYGKPYLSDLRND